MKKDAYLAIVNRAAGGGKCGKLAEKALAHLRSAGLKVDALDTTAPGDATRLAREGYEQGYRQFIAVGGDGTAYEIINGLFTNVASHKRVALGFLPLGTGNSFLRDFTKEGLKHATEAILSGKRRSCDVIRVTHSEGELHYINLLSVGFTADVTAMANRRFKRLGELGYILGVLGCLALLRRRAFPLRVDGAELEDGRCLFLTFNNSKFTGGKMMIAPNAETDDSLVEFVRWGPIGRLGLLRNFPALFDGTHVNHPLASRKGARKIEFQLEGPVDVMVDGEVLALNLRTLEVLPGALDVMA
ncbi:MAG TPA: diacylglycerol kinase family protein [Candidatus Acidoferrum sp.]|nr:diacylglycerol kinase family protein [Candidatus Acidoferrum sp.]